MRDLKNKPALLGLVMMSIVIAPFTGFAQTGGKSFEADRLSCHPNQDGSAWVMVDGKPYDCVIGFCADLRNVVAQAKQNSKKISISHSSAGGCMLTMGPEDLTKKYRAIQESNKALGIQVDDLKKQLAQCPNVPSQQVAPTQINNLQSVLNDMNASQQGGTHNSAPVK